MSKPIEVSNIGRRQLGKVLTCSILLFCLNRQAYSHEVETNRMSLVQRDQAHVIATFYITTTDFFQPVPFKLMHAFLNQILKCISDHVIE